MSLPFLPGGLVVHYLVVVFQPGVASQVKPGLSRALWSFISKRLSLHSYVCCCLCLSHCYLGMSLQMSCSYAL